MQVVRKALADLDPSTTSPAKLGAVGALHVCSSDPDLLHVLHLTGRKYGVRTIVSATRSEVLTRCETGQLGLVILDLDQESELPESLFSLIPGRVIVVSGRESVSLAVQAIRAGAHDYSGKPLAVNRVQDWVLEWLRAEQQSRLTDSLASDMLGESALHDVVGRSAKMTEVFTRMQRIAPHYQSVLVTGDTGTGKELIARGLHRISPWSDGPLVVCNCAALVDTLFESELFGYTKGSFTGATADKTGLVEAAEGGALFLDEIGEMPLSTQAKLLRVLQNREVQRLGSVAAKSVNVRFIAATNRDLKAMVKAGTFREDLYYRLSMVQIHLPPLADRKEDLDVLIRHFLRKFADRYGRVAFELSAPALTFLRRYQWPGNVRELENALGYACMVAPTPTIQLLDLPEWLTQPMQGSAISSDLTMSMEDMERSYASAVLESVGGNRFRAAEILQISRATLYRLLPIAKSA